MAAALCLKDVIAIISVRQETRQTAIGTKYRVARIARTRAAFVTVAVTDHANPTTEFKPICQDSLETAPSGMHFDSCFDVSVVVIVNVGVTPPDMGIHDDVFARVAKCFVEIG